MNGLFHKMRIFCTYIFLGVSVLSAYATAESFSEKDTAARNEVEAKIALANAKTAHIAELERIDAEIESLKTMLTRLSELKKLREEKLTGLSKTTADIDKKLLVDKIHLQKIDATLNSFYKKILSKNNLNMISFEDFIDKSPNEKFRYVASILLKMRELDSQVIKNADSTFQTGVYQKASGNLKEGLLKFEEVEGR